MKLYTVLGQKTVLFRWKKETFFYGTVYPKSKQISSSKGPY